MPADFAPQLARLARRPPAGDAWLHELKYDGYRIGCRIEDGTVRLLSRAGKDWTAAFPEVRDAALRLGVARAFLDGEVAIVLPDGRTSFQALQNAFRGGARDRLVYFAFDLLHLDGVDVARLPLEARKAALASLVAPPRAGGRGTSSRPERTSRRDTAVIRFADHVVGEGAAFFAEVSRLGLEGMVSKRRDRPYEPGRQGGWLKTKCLRHEELVIGGFTDPEGTRPGIGALLLGRELEPGRLAFAGKVGTGFTQESASALRRTLAPLEIRACPFTPPPTGPRRGVHWVRPELRAAVAFSEWTADGKIRQASFQELRRDRSR